MKYGHMNFVDAIYLTYIFMNYLENGQQMFLWVGHNVDPKWVQDVFGVQSFAQIDIDKVNII